MASYRFCRSDDVPLLVRAYNECFLPEEEAAPIDVDTFKRWVRTIELWTSSCMVASEGERLIGVLLAAKREKEGENLLLAVGVHPEFRHAEHGRHLVTSLSQKLAILGPPRIHAELPDSRPRCGPFLEHCGFSAGPAFRDLRLDPPFAPSGLPPDFVAEVSLEELDEAGPPPFGGPLPWARSGDSVRRRREYVGGLRALALAGADRVEAALVLDESDPAARRVLTLRHADERSLPLAGRLLAHAAAQGTTPLLWEAVHEDECPPQRAGAWGLAEGERVVRWSADAVPA